MESTGLSLPVDRWVDIYNVHARRRDGIEEIFADIWRDGYFCSIFAVANQARCARDWQDDERKNYFGSFGSLRKSITFAVAKETGDLPATEAQRPTAIFEIIDIDKQKCSNKRLGNERPNRQLRTFT